MPLAISPTTQGRFPSNDGDSLSPCVVQWEKSVAGESQFVWKLTSLWPIRFDARKLRDHVTSCEMNYEAPIIDFVYDRVLQNSDDGNVVDSSRSEKELSRCNLSMPSAVKTAMLDAVKSKLRMRNC